jgi:hypothetical protein
VRDRGRRRGPLEACEQEALDRLSIGSRFGEALLDIDRRERPGSGEREIQVEMEPGARCCQPAREKLLGEGAGQTVEDESERLEILDRGLDGQGESEPLGGMARPERLEFLTARPGVDPGALLTEASDERGPGELGDRPDPAQTEAREAGSDVRIRSEKTGWVWGEEGGLAARRDEDGRPGSGEDGGDRRREARPGDPGPDLAIPAEHAPQRLRQPTDEDRFRTPQRLETVDLDLEQPEGGVERVDAAGDPRTERRERLEGGLDGRPVRVGVRIDEGRLRDEPVGAPERHPPPDAQCPSFRVGVDDRARIPRPPAQDERAGREGLEGSRPGEFEGEVRPMEMEESHRG